MGGVPSTPVKIKLLFPTTRKTGTPPYVNQFSQLVPYDFLAWENSTSPSQGISDFIKKQLPSDTTAVDISQPTGKDWALLDVERHAFIHKSQVDEMIRCTPAHVVPHYKTPEGQKFIVLRLTQCSWEKEWQSNWKFIASLLPSTGEGTQPFQSMPNRFTHTPTSTSWPMIDPKSNTLGKIYISLLVPHFPFPWDMILPNNGHLMKLQIDNFLDDLCIPAQYLPERSAWDLLSFHASGPDHLSLKSCNHLSNLVMGNQIYVLLWPSTRIAQLSQHTILHSTSILAKNFIGEGPGCALSSFSLGTFIEPGLHRWCQFHLCETGFDDDSYRVYSTTSSTGIITPATESAVGSDTDTNDGTCTPVPGRVGLELLKFIPADNGTKRTERRHRGRKWDRR